MAATDTLIDKAMKKALKDASTAGKPKRVSDGGGLYFVARLAAAGLPGPGTFEHTAREWHEYSKAQWSSRHAVKVLALLENDLLPFLGARSLADIAAPELLQQARGSKRVAWVKPPIAR